MDRWRVAILGCVAATAGWPALPHARAQATAASAPVTATSFAGSRPTEGRTAPETRRAQVEAATEDALDILRRDVLASSLAPDLTVRQFLYRTGGTDDLLRQIDNAEQQLIAALDAAPDDEMATERITAALNRLRNAQARHTAAVSGLPHLPDLVGWG